MQEAALSFEEVEHIAALERWLVREVVQRLLEPFLSIVEPMSISPKTDSTSDHEVETFAHQLFRFLLGFPPFRGQPRIERAVADVFAVLPRIHASIQARGGPNSRGLKTLLAPALSGPILSAARTYRAAEKLGQKSSECGSIFLRELHDEADGLAHFLEELKCTHALNELRPSAFAWVNAIRQEIIDHLILASKEPIRLRRMFAQVPRKAIMLMLKTNTTSGALAASVRLLFARPLGAKSVLQRLVADSLNYQNISDDIAVYELQLSKQSQRLDIIRRYGAEEQELVGDSHDEKCVLRRKVALSSYLVLESGGNDRFANDQEVLRAVRYIDLLQRKHSTDDLLGALGDERLVDALCNLILCTHEALAQSLFAKGSGLVKLAEDLFACIDAALHSPEETPFEAINDQFDQLVDRVLNRALGLIHNVLLADRHMLLHDSLHWYFDVYKNAADVRLPTEKLIVGLRRNESRRDDVKAVVDEARKVFERERSNRTPGTTWQPRPRLPATERVLLPLFTLAVRDNLIPPPSQRRASSHLANGMQALVATKKEGLINMEVVFTHAETEVWSNLSVRKFVLCGRLRSASLWIRHASDAPFTGPLWNPSIVEIALTNSEQRGPVETATSGHWIVIPKNLNKSSMLAGKLFLWFRRARNTEEEVERILGLEILPSDVDDRKKRAMESCGYRVVCTIGTGVLQQSQVWMLGGLNKNEFPG